MDDPPTDGDLVMLLDLSAVRGGAIAHCVGLQLMPWNRLIDRGLVTIAETDLSKPSAISGGGIIITPLGRAVVDAMIAAGRVTLENKETSKNG